MSSLVARAIVFADRAHEGQRYGDRPYTVHLQDVVAILYSFDLLDPNLLCAGWLHDTIEDTRTAHETLLAEFGKEVADLVFAVTCGPGKNRFERNELMYPKIRSTPRAVLVKLADRIANVTECWRTQDARLFMYRREHPRFREALYDADDPIAKPLWNKLDRLLGVTR